MEPLVGELLVPQYQMSLFLLSYVVSFFGALVALQSVKWMFRKDGTLNWELTTCAAVALGGIGIWSMHFIGMLSYRLPVPIAYDLGMTLSSLVAAIVLSGISLYLASGRGKFRISGWLAGSLLAGLGASVMHYMGMYAMNLRAVMSLDLLTVAASVAIAIIAAAAALWLAFNVTKLSHQLAAAVFMALAVCTMHYVGMWAASMICITEAPLIPLKISGKNLGIWVFLVSALVLMYIFWIVSSISMKTDEAKDSVPQPS
jgi:NO-binding membrane sensor protein with MHYT domain